MKYILITLFALFTLASCNNDDFKDVEITYFDGKWYSDKCNLEFNSTDENFKLVTKEHTAYCYFGLNEDKNEISIVYAEDEDGNELLSEEDYENGYFCHYTVIDKKKMKIKNLPYFSNEEIEFHK